MLSCSHVLTVSACCSWYACALCARSSVGAAKGEVEDLQEATCVSCDESGEGGDAEHRDELEVGIPTKAASIRSSSIISVRPCAFARYGDIHPCLRGAVSMNARMCTWPPRLAESDAASGLIRRAAFE